jgi:hypothetical protein
MVAQLPRLKAVASNILEYGAPVPSFGDPDSATVATLGLNPSCFEFINRDGAELDGEIRRFPTLGSLGITSWEQASDVHLSSIASSCSTYFKRNPYDSWFGQLDALLRAANFSYYGDSGACHFDLVPYATICKWSDLSVRERKLLIDLSGTTLAELIEQSAVRALILNGASVVSEFEKLVGNQLPKIQMDEWTLPRKSGQGVRGYAVSGRVHAIAGKPLSRPLLVIGFNHNIQSSFGVTSRVRNAIAHWIGRELKDLHEAK